MRLYFRPRLEHSDLLERTARQREKLRDDFLAWYRHRFDHADRLHGADLDWMMNELSDMVDWLTVQVTTASSYRISTAERENGPVSQALRAAQAGLEHLRMYWVTR